MRFTVLSVPSEKVTNHIKQAPTELPTTNFVSKIAFVIMYPQVVAPAIEATTMAKMMSTWKAKGVTIVSDGWSDPTRKPLINFIAITGNAPLFLKAVDCSGKVKDKFFISNLMKEVINEVGHQNVVQIITDNAANCKAAGEIVDLERV
ncbi:unnamed protein product [Arabidopsis lyrata]|nr:unnamed protein product [Arabidopsis lyrata]